MSARVTVSLGAGGLVAVKTAATPEEIARLHDEVARLRRVGHPGVVTLVGSGLADRGVEMRTVYAGDPLERWRGSLRRAAGVGAVVAATLADLHDMGVVHGRLDGSHVLIGPDGRPQLCGLSDPGDATPADDVLALGELMNRLIERCAGQDGGHRRWLRRPRTEQRALHHAARRALDPMPSRRPSARSLARAVLTAVPGAELPPAPAAAPDVEPAAPGSDPTQPSVGAAIPAPHPAHDRPAPWQGAERASEPSPLPFTRTGSLPRPAPRERRPLRRGGATGAEMPSGSGLLRWEPGDDATPRRTAIGIVTAGVTAVALMIGGGMALQDRAARVDRTAHADVVAGMEAGDGDHGGGKTCGRVVVPAADVNGDGCPESLHVDGRTIRAGTVRWRLGEPGDVVAVGRWDCGPSAVPAVLRPTTGDVFVFWGWATAGRPLTAEPVRQVAGATVIRAEPAADGCDRLVVQREDEREGEGDVVVGVDRP